jgi:hypothetical protein
MAVEIPEPKTYWVRYVNEGSEMVLHREEVGGEMVVKRYDSEEAAKAECGWFDVVAARREKDGRTD